MIQQVNKNITGCEQFIKMELDVVNAYTQKIQRGGGLGETRTAG